MTTIKHADIRYLALEGGGGKGVAYLGAVMALEALGVLPIDVAGNVPSYSAGEMKVTHARTSQIRGISGSSAGAITAFCLAMGLGSKEILDVLGMKTTYLGASMSVFNTFFDAPGLEDKIGNLAGWRDYQSMLADRAETWHVYRTVEAEGSLQERNSPEEGRLFNSRDKDAELDIPYVPRIAEQLIQRFGVSHFLPAMKDVSVIDALLGFPGEGVKTTPLSYVKTMYHVRNLLFGGGLFTGRSVRKFLTGLLRKYLLENPKLREVIDGRTNGFNKSVAGHPQREIVFTDEMPDKELDTPRTYDAGKLTFRQFHYLTGVDLVVTGTNLTNQIPLYFSADRTPDFPVVEAVGISMNIPVLFSPVEINSKVYIDVTEFKRKVENSDSAHARYNAMYRGLYGDGGILNNLPIHAFNAADDPFVEHVDPRARKRVKPFNRSVLGLRLTDGFRGDRHKDDGKVDVRADMHVLSILGVLVNTFGYHAELGQIRDDEERDHIIHCYTHYLAIENFHAPDHRRDLPIFESFLEAARYFGHYPTSKIPSFEGKYPAMRPGLGLSRWMRKVELNLMEEAFRKNFQSVRKKVYDETNKGFSAGADPKAQTALVKAYGALFDALQRWTD